MSEIGNGSVNVDGGGIGGGGSTQSACHLTVERRITRGELCDKSEVTYQGPWDDILELAKSYETGDTSHGDLSDLPQGEGDTGENGAVRTSSVVASRSSGSVGKLTILFTQNLHRCSFGVDWVEVSKPIRTWRADKDDAPDLAKIRQWEDQKTGNTSAYYGFKVGNTELTGNTKSLAEFISKGIENYSRYAPVVTISCNIEMPERVGETYPRIGTVGTPTAPNGWTNAAGKTVQDIVNGIGNSPDTGSPYVWLLSKSQLSQNSDGTHRWDIAWQGADSIEESLYGDTGSGTGAST